MRTQIILPLLLLLAFWTSPLRAEEPAGTVVLPPLGGVSLEVPHPEGYVSLPESSPEFKAFAEQIQKAGPMRLLAVFRPAGPEPASQKFLLICGQESFAMTPLGVKAMLGVFKNMDWTAEARNWAKAHGQEDPNADTTQMGLFAESDLSVAAATVAPSGDGSLLGTIMMVMIVDGKPLFFYFYESLASKDTLPGLKTEARRYLKAYEDTGRLRLNEAGGQ